MSSYKPSIFISYRHSNSTPVAQTIYKQLQAQRYDVFLDQKGRFSGSLVQDILKEIASRSHFLLILTQGTLKDSTKANDRLRREIECAVHTERHIIPVLVGESDFEKELDYLPKSLHATLSHQQTFRIQPDYPEAGLQAVLGAVKVRREKAKAAKISKSSVKSDTIPEAMKTKLQEDNLYTVLYAYVRQFAPGQTYMLHNPRQETAAELKKSAYEIAKTLQKQYHMNLTSTVDDVMRLVEEQQYDAAKKYILARVDKIEQEIRSLS